ncbi:MAG: response regulator [Chloroflexales bacterium]|nr:response regulator [Chloroflexales bacterium]
MIKILLVEDDTMNRDMIARYMSMEGYSVITAINGEQAVTVVRENTPHLILMDMGLPMMDGWEAVRKIREMSMERYIPIIALTAYVMAEDRERCLAAGCDEYESKPVDFPRLLVKMQKLLEQTSV